MSVLTLAAKEIRTLFSSPIAYAVIAVFIVLSGYTFTVTLFISKQATLVHIFFQAAVQLILLVPLITMRQFAEERRSGTLELLLTAPVREIDIVVAKFIACMVVLALMTGLTLIYAVVLSSLWPAGLGSDLQRLRRPRHVRGGAGLDWPDDLGIDRQPNRRCRGVARIVRHPLGDRHTGLVAAAPV